MNPTDPELEALRRKIERIEADLASAKESLGRWESGPISSEVEPPRLEESVPIGVADSEPLPKPPAMAEPPLLSKPPLRSLEPASKPIRDWLASCHMWPPSDEGDTEVRLAAWWATRLGALLAVIGVVFFAVYVSRNTSPMVKLIELIVVSLGTVAAGLRLERSVAKFARVLIGTGLALVYFSAVAAYLIPATQVIIDPAVAIVTQLLVVVAIVLFALWRRSQSTVTMAVLFGYGTTLAGCYAELDSFILWSALGFGAVAVAVKLKAGWRSPSILAVPLMYATYAAFYFWQAPHQPPPAVSGLWLPLLAALMLFILRDGLSSWRSGTELSREDRIVQNLNSSLAISAGWSVTWHFLPERLATFYFGSAAILLLIAIGWHATKKSGSVVVVTATQASAMLALGLATHFQGHLTSLVLLAQAAGLLVAIRFSGLRGLRGLRVIFYLVWGYSLYLFADALGQGSTMPVSLALIYVGLSAALLGFDQRWCEARAGLSRFAGVLLGLNAWATIDLWHGTAWETVWLGAVALVLCVGGWPSRAWRGAGVAAGIALLGMFLAVFNYHVRIFEPWQHWTNGAGMVLVVLLIALFWDRMNPLESKSGRWWRGVLVIAASLALEIIFWKGLRHGQDVACASAAAVVLLTIGPWAKRWPLAIAGMVGLAYGLFLHHPFQVREGYPMLFLAAALAWALPVIWQHSPSCRERVRHLSWQQAMPWCFAGLATWISVLALQSNFSGAELHLFTAVEAVAIFFLAWKLGAKVTSPAASVILGFGAFWIARMLILLDAPMEWQAGSLLQFGGVVAIVAVMLGIPLAARSFTTERWSTLSLVTHGAVALILFYWFFAAQGAPLRAYTTVIWGGGALVVFGLGLFLRTRVYRMLGLLGLVLCVPRIFLIDLNSTLHRIVAFVVLGVVMLWVGFSYHRFRHLVTGELKPPKPE